MDRPVVVLLVALATASAVKVPESGYLFTAPKVLQAGTDERACLSLFNLPGPNRALNLKFYERDVPSSLSTTLDKSDFLLFETNTAVPDSVAENGEYCFDITIPSKVVARSADMHMELTAGEGVWKEESVVTLKSETFLTLVQTDKSKYQPGQKVLFRVVTLSHDLTALNNDLNEVWVTTPDNIRVAQWKNVKTNTGMVQLELQLTEEPPLGSWTIHVRTTQDTYTKRFTVEEYVLPTFELEIEAPESLESNEKTVTVKVCAKYTFGKPLIAANVSINATARGIGSWQYNNNKDLLRNISDYQFSDEQGCAIFDLVVSKIGIGHRNIGGGNTVIITIDVEEQGTGLRQVEVKEVSQAYSFINLRQSDNAQKFLKPKLPFYGEYTLSMRDGKAAKNEIVKVCYTAKYKERVISDEKKPTPDDPVYSTHKKYESHVQIEFGYTPFFWETSEPNRRTTGGECREYKTDENGRIVYYIPPQAEDIDSIDISTSTSVGGDSDSSHSTLTAFFSPSHSYLSIDAHELPEQLPCSGDVTVKLLSTEEGPVPAMVYKILSRGKIIKAGNMNTNTLTFPVLPKMGPEFKLLVYYIKESGEVVSDSRVFKVDKCFPNTVQVSWDQKTVKPGDSASFTVRASPNSVCGISAVDKSTELLGTSNQITLDTVFSKLQQFIINSFESPNQVRSDGDYCRELQLSLVDTLRSGGATVAELTGQSTPEGTPESETSGAAHSSLFIPPPTRSQRFRTDREDAIKPFDEAGFLVLSNLALETRPCYKRVQAKELPELTEDKIQASRDGEEELLDDLDSPVPALAFSKESADASRFAAEGGVSGGGGAAPPQEDQVRDFFPEAFLFSIETLDAEGVKTVTSEMPDTITSWVGSAICTNSKDGFGISNKTSITTFKPFFTEVSLPYSMKRGEILSMSVSVFNFLDSSLSVYLEVGASDQYEISGEVAMGLCIAAGRTEVRSFPVNFLGLGEVNITVTARAQDGYCDEGNTIAPGSDTVIRPIVVKPEGFPQEVTHSRFICLDKDDDHHTETVNLPVPEGLVPDSQRAYFSVIGDLLGQTFQGLEGGLIKSPTGAGEPNMITLVPNIYIRRYLETTGQLNERQRRQLEHNMKSGYQRQLRFRRYDGSFSSYGNEDPQGSMWLTAFVVKAFREASEYIEIDETIINKAKDWILKKQNTTGCFPRFGELIHKELKGGTERGGEAALTAFVMLALKDIATTTELANGFACLEDGLLLPNKTLYSEILLAYTYLNMGQDVKGERLVNKLMSKAKREGDDILYWEGDRDSLFGGSRAVDVEMTAYMALSLMHISGKGNMEEAARAIRWINTQRNSNGGFKSTQDTIVAVEALSEFASRTFASDLATSVSVTAGGETVQRMVDGDNRLLYQESKVPDLTLPGTMNFDVSPPGCVVYQSIFRFSSTLEVPDPAFSLGVAAKKRGRTGYELEVCTSFLRNSGAVDRAILETELPSGYVAVDSTLRDLRRGSAVRSYEIKEGKVIFTLQGVAEDKTCLEFRIIQENEVEQLKPSIVKVHDFYRPEERNIQEYELTPAA
ncbi:murinoglobulin-2-like isoform X3 [Amphibalanus amphitrite]|uniref:murinoglobulin-2-like isoform X3 n=1 Tax=Amphibalanus amphitrite TaxID=1232801 RepID=UPI001C92889A|nr:murinoglobulin-2-like isoform X3 [Amphibalanus amphitrite]